MMASSLTMLSTTFLTTESMLDVQGSVEDEAIFQALSKACLADTTFFIRPRDSTDRLSDRQTGNQTDRLSDRQTYTLSDRQTDTLSDRQTDYQTDRHTHY